MLYTIETSSDLNCLHHALDKAGISTAPGPKSQHIAGTGSCGRGALGYGNLGGASYYHVTVDVESLEALKVALDWPYDIYETDGLALGKQISGRGVDA